MDLAGRDLLVVGLEFTLRIFNTLVDFAASAAKPRWGAAINSVIASPAKALSAFAVAVFDGVIGCFLRNSDVMWMALPHAGG